MLGKKIISKAVVSAAALALLAAIPMYAPAPDSTSISANAVVSNSSHSEELNDNGSELSSYSTWANWTITAKAKFIGGSGTYKYRYSYKMYNDEKWTDVSGLTNKDSFKIKVPDSYGICKIRIAAIDSNKKSQSKILKVNIKKDTKKDFKEKNIKINSNNVYVSELNKAHIDVDGGVKPYSYKYSYKKKGSSEWILESDYISKNEKDIKMPSKPGEYTVRVAAKDAVGNYVSKYMDVTVKKDTGKKLDTNKSSLSAQSTWANWTITANAVADGGVKPYKYKYSYKKQKSSSWMYESSYTSSDSGKLKMPDQAGIYTVRIAAKDANGNYTSKYIDIIVKKDTKKTFVENGSTVDNESPKQNVCVKANASFSGGVAPYRYKYSYRYGNESWKDVTDYTYSDSQKINIPSKSGKYTVRIASKDSVGTYKSKYLYVSNIDINDSDIFVKQKTDYTCTLASNVMLLRRNMFLKGDSSWSSITEDSCRPHIWSEGAGMYNNYTYKNMEVSYENIQSYSDRRKKIIETLNQHPEGIVIYEFDIPHAVLLTDYTDGVFYVADPARNVDSGRIPISLTKLNIDTVDSYWYISN